MSSYLQDSEEFSVLLRNGTAGSVALGAIATPLDVARRSAQAALAAKKQPSGLFASLSAAHTRGCLFRGIVPTVLKAAVGTPIFLLVYHWQKDNRPPVDAAAMALATRAWMLQPVEFVRACRQSGVQLSPGTGAHLERGIWEMIVQDGAASFWRSFVPTMIRDVTAGVAFWHGYMALQNTYPEYADSTIHISGFASASAAAAAVITQPLDFVKTRMQVHQLVRPGEDGYNRMKVARWRPIVAETWKIAGARGFWVGCLSRTLRAAAGGLVMGPFFQYAQLIAKDEAKPRRQAFIVPPDPSNTIVHPRSQKAMYIEVK